MTRIDYEATHIPDSERIIDRAVKRVTLSKMGRPTAIPGVVVVDTFPSGQAKTYRYKGKLLNRRQYFKLLQELREKGVIAPKSDGASPSADGASDGSSPTP